MMDAKTMCLGALMLGDATGYDIRKRVEETFSHFLDVSLGAIYPAPRGQGHLHQGHAGGQA